MIFAIQWCKNHGAQIDHRSGECWPHKLNSNPDIDGCVAVDATVIVPTAAYGQTMYL